MRYIIHQTDGWPDWDAIESVDIREYSWGGDYRPGCEAKLCLVKQKGFLLRMACRESNPKAVFFHRDDPVYLDSCMEFFINFKPQKPDSGYINFECNANGALLCEYGTQRKNRSHLADRVADVPKPEVFMDSARWGYELFIPLDLIFQVYGDSSFGTGDLLKGNFYKCGDNTDPPHYGSWTKIISPAPNFHQPEFFGELEIG